MSETTDPPPLGECPRCGSEVPAGNLGIVYGPDNGWPQLLAECPECESAISPE